MLEQLLSPVNWDGMEARSKSQHFDNESSHALELEEGVKIDLHNDHHAELIWILVDVCIQRMIQSASNKDNDQPITSFTFLVFTLYIHAYINYSVKII